MSNTNHLEKTPIRVKFEAKGSLNNEHGVVWAYEGERLVDVMNNADTFIPITLAYKSQSEYTVVFNKLSIVRIWEI